MRPILYLRNVVTLAYEPKMCNGCGACLNVCPREVLRRSDGKIEIATRDACIECGACQRNCPQGALTVRAGVGCASAIINRMLDLKKACCTVEDAGPSCA